MTNIKFLLILFFFSEIATSSMPGFTRSEPEVLPSSLEPIKNAFLHNFVNPSDLDFLERQYLREEILNEKLRILKPLLNKSYKAAIGPIDQARDLVDSDIQYLLTSVVEIHRAGLSDYKLKEAFWTGYFWAMHKGLLGARLADSNFSREETWPDRLEYIKSNPPSSYITRKKIFALSPSEKYDLLIGDKDGNLTSYMWRMGQETMDKYGTIATWIGLCDGMAMASTNLPFPKKSVVLTSIDKKHKIKFFPEDIKALGTLLWKQGELFYKIIGERCDEQLPEVNNEGRYTTEACFNSNPGTFHLSLVNQIGRAKRSFIMDSMSNFEVWNYSIVGYSFKYFNPQTGKEFKEPGKAIIPLADYANDQFKEFRSPDTTHIIAVEADVEYLRERYPRFRDRESIEDNKPTSHVYRYDLELDSSGVIIGGEWQDNNHPDFLWIPMKNTIVKGPFDDSMEGNWDAKAELFPESWVEMAVKSSKTGIVPHQIVGELFKLSNLEQDGFDPK